MRVKAFAASCLTLLFASVCALPGEPALARTAESPAASTQTPRENPSTDVDAQQPPASAQLIVDEAPAATQTAPRELARTPPPAPATNQATNNAAAEQAASGTSLRALLMRNWAVVLVAGVLLAGLGLFAVSRRPRAGAAPPPALHTRPAVKLVEARATAPEAAAPTVVNGEGEAAGEETARAGAVATAFASVASSVTAEEVDAPEPGAKAPNEGSAEAAPCAAAPPVWESAAGRQKGGAALDEQASLPADLQQRLASREPSERAAALAELARFDTGESFRQICAAFDDEADDVRAAAARALYDVRGDRADAFTRALREATESRRRHIGQAIAASGLASDAISQLTGESRGQTYEAFSLLFLMAKAGEVRPLVRAVEDHPSNEVRLAVVKLLALSGQKEILPAFRRLAVRGNLPPEVRTAVMETIYQISSQTETTPAA